MLAARSSLDLRTPAGDQALTWDSPQPSHTGWAHSLSFLKPLVEFVTTLLRSYAFGLWASRHVGSQLPDQGLNLRVLPWKARSELPDPQGSPGRISPKSFSPLDFPPLPPLSPRPVAPVQAQSLGICGSQRRVLGWGILGREPEADLA